MSRVGLNLMAVAIAATAVLASPVAKATGGGDECDDVACNSFFTPEIIGRPSDVPFFRSGHTFYGGGDIDQSAGTIKTISELNLNEWSAKLGGRVDAKLLNELVYKMKRDDVNAVATALNGGQVNLNDQQKAIVKALSPIANAKELVSYIVFSKDVEPIVTRRLNDDAWYADGAPKANPSDIARAGVLILQAKKDLAATKDSFIADRLKLQIDRLMFYSGRFGEAEAFATAQLPTIKTNGTVKHRLIDTAAGAFYKEKKYGMANYLYSLNFDNYAPLKQSSYFSFHPQEQADWQQSLKFAKTKRQLEVLWQMFGITADGLVAIQKIYALDAKSDLLPLLLVREVNIAEEAIVQTEDFNANAVNDQYRIDARAKAKVIGQQRMTLIKSIADAGKTSQSYLWDLATAHLFAIQGDLSNTSKYLALAEKNGLPAGSLAANQARSTKLIATIQALPAVEKSKETYLGQELLWLKSNASTDPYSGKPIAVRAGNLQTYLLGKLSALYLKQGDVVTALMLNDVPASPVYGNNALLDQLIALKLKPTKTAFEKELVANYAYKISDIEELKAINLLYAGKFVQAHALFAKLPQTADQQLDADPFLIHIDDCHDCDQLKAHPKITKAEFALKMARLQQQAKLPGPMGAAASFAFANGIYNMSMYGNSRMLFTTANENLAGSPKVLNNKAAMAFYDRAMTLAPDSESAAKSAFMAAKTEQNEFYNAQIAKDNYYEDDKGAPHSPKYFAILKAKYANTKYYQEIIKECGEFRTYLKTP